MVFTSLYYLEIDLFNIKNMAVRPKCACVSHLTKKLPNFRSQTFYKYRERFGIYGHRYWSLEEYELLFNTVLEKSRPVLLDNIPCILSIRYLVLYFLSFS